MADRKCVSCGHNKRVPNKDGISFDCFCEITGKRIGYIECFEHWCHHWKRDRKWDGKEDKNASD